MAERPPVPAELERALLLEAGHRCAIPTCRAIGPLQLEHIEMIGPGFEDTTSRI
jgi:hypothetical protein